MNRDNILTADVLDIIFDGRNKAYGAYNLRKTYDERIKFALMGTATLSFLFFLSTVINFSKKKPTQIYVGDEISLTGAIKEVEKVVPPPPPPAPKQQQIKVETEAFTTPVITEQVIDPPPSVDVLTDVKISTQNIEGVKSDGTITPPVEASTTNGTGPIAKKADDPEGEFKTVQIEAAYPGGKDGWMRFLERNLNREAPSEAGAPMGKYTVAISFRVDEKGNLSDIIAENNPGYGTAEEAVRVIKKSGSWKPAIQNGRTVAFRAKQTITFVVQEP